MSKFTFPEHRANQILSRNMFDNETVLLGKNLGTLLIQPPDTCSSILRMLIGYRGDIKLPIEFEWVRPLLDLSISELERINIRMPYIYLTVRHNFYTKNATEWHVDGYSERVSHLPEHNFLWSDTGGTQVKNGRATLPDYFNPRVHNINTHLMFADDTVISTLQPNEVFWFDPYVLHKAPDDTSVRRTVVRISHLPIEIDDINNTQNTELPRTYSYDGLAFRNTLQ